MFQLFPEFSQHKKPFKIRKNNLNPKILKIKKFFQNTQHCNNKDRKLHQIFLIKINNYFNKKTKTKTVQMKDSKNYFNTI